MESKVFLITGVSSGLAWISTSAYYAKDKPGFCTSGGQDEFHIVPPGDGDRLVQ
jgi:hypothetical protein